MTIHKTVTLICDKTQTVFVPTGDNVSPRIAVQQAKQQGWTEISLGEAVLHFSPNVNVTDLLGVKVEPKAPKSPGQAPETTLVDFEDDNDDEDEGDEAA